MERFILSISLFGRQWSQWEILTISTAVLLVLVWITRQQRSKKVQSKYNKEEFPDNSPFVGLKFGAHNKSQHVVKDWKQDRLAPVQKHQNKQRLQKQEPSEKPHKEIKQLQKQTIEHKQAKASLERRVSKLTADNRKLQRQLAESKQAETQKQQLQTKEFLEKLQEEIKLLQNETFHHKQANIRFEQQVSELTAHNEILQRELDKYRQAESQNRQHLQTLEKLQEENKQLQNEITEHKQAKESFERRITELTTGNAELQSELNKYRQVESQNRQHLQTLEKLQEENKQLRHEITEHKQAKENFERQISDLTAENEKLQHELARFEQAEQQIAEMTAVCRQLQPEGTQVELKSGRQVSPEPAVEMPVKRKTAGRSKTYQQRHRTVDGVRQKLCRKCKEWKPEGEFHKNSSSKDGLAYSCKLCKNNAARERRSRRQAAQS